MEEFLDEVEKIQTFSDKEIFTEIWSQPRAVLQYIHDHKYDKFVIGLLTLSGISSSFDRAETKNMGDNLSLPTIIFTSIFVGALTGWLTFYIYSALLSWTGKWLDGKGDTNSILRITAYSIIPSILGLVLLIPKIGIYGIEIFKSDGDFESGGMEANYIYYGSLLIEIILGIFSIIFATIGISIVQNFTIGKSILNIFLPILVIAVPVLIFLIIKM